MSQEEDFHRKMKKNLKQFDFIWWLFESDRWFCACFFWYLLTERNKIYFTFEIRMYCRQKKRRKNWRSILGWRKCLFKSIKRRNTNCEKFGFQKLNKNELFSSDIDEWKRTKESKKKVKKKVLRHESHIRSNARKTLWITINYAIVGFSTFAWFLHISSDFNNWYRRTWDWQSNFSLLILIINIPNFHSSNSLSLSLNPKFYFLFFPKFNWKSFFLRIKLKLKRKLFLT